MSVHSNDSAIAYANTRQQALTENSDWAPYQVTLDIPEISRNIDFGVALTGQGTVWIDDCKIDIVDNSVPNDDMVAKGLTARQPLIKKTEQLNPTPVNMGFEEK